MRNSLTSFPVYRMVLGMALLRHCFFTVFTQESYIPHRKGGGRGNSWRKASPKRRREIKQRHARVHLYTGTGTRYPAPPTPRSRAPPIRQIKIRQSSKICENDESAKYNSRQYFRPYVYYTVARLYHALSSVPIAGFIPVGNNYTANHYSDRYSNQNCLRN